MNDIFNEWHEYLKIIKEGYRCGDLKGDMPSDFDLAAEYVIGIAWKHNYKILTSDMIWHLMKAFTDVVPEDKERKNE